MTEPESNANPGRTAWVKSAIGGVVAAVVYVWLTGAGLVSGLVLGLVFALLAGAMLRRRAGHEGAGQERAGQERAGQGTAPNLPTEPVAAPDPQPPAPAAPLVRSGTQLPGEAELAARKGSWRYESNGAAG